MKSEKIFGYYGEPVETLKNGYKITIPNGKHAIIRIMNEGSGQRELPYFRVSIKDLGSLSLDGALSSDAVNTHINLTKDYYDQIIRMISTYKGGK